MLSASAARREFKQHTQLVSGTRLQQEVTFSTIILHRISAYITWSAVPPSDQCNVTKSRVIGYRLRYQPTDNHTEFVSQNLSENVVLLENLQSGKYRYQVKYLLENGEETAWSVEGIFDTMPSQHWTVLLLLKTLKCLSHVHDELSRLEWCNYYCFMAMCMFRTICSVVWAKQICNNSRSFVRIDHCLMWSIMNGGGVRATQSCVELFSVNSNDYECIII